MQNRIDFLKRKYKSILRFAGQAKKGNVLVVIMASMAITTGMTLESFPSTKAERNKLSEVHYTQSQEFVYADIAEAIITREETTTELTTTTSTTSTTDVTTTESITSTAPAETTEVTNTTTTVAQATEQSEIVAEVVYSSVGQYGFAIDPEEYVYLAEVIEHEGGDCPLYVKEHIGICLLNRVFVPGFMDSIYGCKEQSGQYFSGYYPFSEESAELAKTMIATYNSGGENWSKYCEERGMNSRTKFQRNDYCVPGTTYVIDDYDCTSGGFWFHMYYSE